MKSIYALLFVMLLTSAVTAQEPLQILKTNSKVLDIRDGQVFNKQSWTVAPEANPDIYPATKIGETVTFYSDVDSISVVITKNTKFDFIVLLNGSDTAHTQIKYQESHLDVLKRAELYSEDQKNDIPSFTYLNSENEHLKQLRKEFKLDSIAGEGDEISQLLNVMQWVHNVVRHDGSSSNPKLKNTADLINVCTLENRGVNCRMMATILNECYLSLGFKTRMVTCMPRQLEFQDCHVINSAYSNQLEKWVWLDPTFDAYVMDEKGELLGLQEVRERLINGQPLILNPTANWNRESTQTKEHYLYEYMAKNLYRLESPIHSTFNAETAEEGKTIEYIQLLPLDGVNQEPKVEVTNSTKSGMTLKTYISNNPKQFWEE